MVALVDVFYALTLLPHYAYHRLITGKYGPDVGEKLGRLPHTLHPASSQSCLWIHAVSVGETLAAKTLLQGFETRHPSWAIRLSTTTATGREVAQKHFGRERVFYFPLDLSWVVKRVLDQIHPTAIVLMELEVWPNLLELAEMRKVPVVVANVRITERSVARFRLFGKAAQRMLGRVTFWFCQSEVYADRLRSLGVAEERIEVVGSLKYDQVPTTLNPETRDRYRRLLGAEGPVVVAGSTHPGEEIAVLEAFSTLRKSEFPSLKLVLVPRHPSRLDEVEALARAVSPVTRRSALSEEHPATTPIILVDTMGELASLYAAADGVFVGGSLIPHGGQNMMEPCGLARPTVMGPSDFNFAEAATLLTSAGALWRISRKEELADVFRAILSDPASSLAAAARGREALLAAQGATRRTLDRLDQILSSSLP